MARSKFTARAQRGTPEFERDYLLRMGLVKPANEASTEALLSTAADHWGGALEAVEGLGLRAAAPELLRGAALLLKVARADARPEARAAERWLVGMGYASALGVAATGGMGAVAPMDSPV